MAIHASVSQSTTLGTTFHLEKIPRLLTQMPPLSGTSSLFSSITKSSFLFVKIVDGQSCLFSREGVVQASSQLRLSDVLYVSDFQVNLLSILAINKKLHCIVTFFPFHSIFQDL